MTNTSVNPARSSGPGMFVGGWAISRLWLFIIAPMIGSLITASVYLAIRPSSLVISVQEAEQALDSEAAERRR